MTEFLPIIGFVAALLVGYGILRLIVGLVLRRKLDHLTATLSAEAAAHGWTVSSERRHGLRAIEWRGSTNGIAWVAVALSGWQGTELQRRRVSATRWQTSDLRGNANPIVLLGMSSHPGIHAAWPSGGGATADLLTTAMLAAIDKYIDEHFAPEIRAVVDATRLQRVEGAERLLAGYIVVAEDPAEAVRVIEHGVGAALSATASTMQSAAPSSPEGYFAVICKEGVGLVRSHAVASLADLHPIVKKGVAIANAVKW